MITAGRKGSKMNYEIQLQPMGDWQPFDGSMFDAFMMDAAALRHTNGEMVYEVYDSTGR